MTPTENVGNATEALGRAMADAACDCEPRQHEPNPLDVAANLEALGWKVVPIDHFVGDDCTEEDIAHFAALEQAAEAADAAAEAAYQDSQNTDPQYREQRAYERGVVDEARRHPDQHPSAAVAPLVAKVLAAGDELTAEHGESCDCEICLAVQPLVDAAVDLAAAAPLDWQCGYLLGHVNAPWWAGPGPSACALRAGHGHDHQPAYRLAVAPLDVEALATALESELGTAHGDTMARSLASAYADAIRKRGGA